MPTMPIAEACDRVGKKLAAKYGTGAMPISEIKREVVALCGCGEDSVLVTDRCYNRHNDGIKITTPRMFEYLGEGEVRYLGLNYPYNGPILHKPKGKDEPERIVGHCTNGVLKLTSETT